MSQFIYDIMYGKGGVKELKHLSFMLSEVTTGEMLPSVGDTKRLFQSLQLTSRHVGLMQDWLKTLGKDIEDRLDVMSVDELKEAGDASIGSEPCEFITNDAIITPENWEVFNRVVEAGLLDQETLISIGNLYARLYKDEVETADRIIQGGSEEELKQLRHQLGEEHLKLGDISHIALLPIINPNEIFEQGVENGLDYNHVIAAYPVSSILCNLFQMQDDVVDFAEDTTFEAESGRPAANFYTSALVGAGAIKTKNGLITDPAIVDRGTQKAVLKEVDAEYRSISAMLPRHLELPLNAIWRSVVAHEERSLEEGLAR